MSAMPQTERQVQRAILAMRGRCFPAVFIHHSPNGAKLAGSLRDRQVAGGILLGDGMKPGFPDLACYWNHGHALMEVKRPGYSPSQVSPAQIATHATLAECGYPPEIVTCPEEAFAFLRARGAPWNGVPVA